jgi:hypothetical protein
LSFGRSARSTGADSPGDDVSSGIVVEVTGADAEADLVEVLVEAAGEYEVSHAKAFGSKRKADAADLMARLPNMTPAERVDAVAAFAAEHGQFGNDLWRLEGELEWLEDEEAGRPHEATGRVEGDIGEIVRIAIPTVTGPLATRLINMTIDWARERAKRTRTPETVEVYGPNGEQLRKVEVSTTGDVSEAPDDG